MKPIQYMSYRNFFEVLEVQTQEWLVPDNVGSPFVIMAFKSTLSTPPFASFLQKSPKFHFIPALIRGLRNKPDGPYSGY
jgi:hypothetical protein